METGDSSRVRPSLSFVVCVGRLARARCDKIYMPCLSLNGHDTLKQSNLSIIIYNAYYDSDRQPDIGIITSSVASYKYRDLIIYTQ